MSNAYEILVGTAEGNRSFGRGKRGGEGKGMVGPVLN
jgi:hypothetical protein